MSRGSGTAYDHHVSNSRDERLALAALLEESGPEAATLCTGWLTRDLAAHLVMRERRPDAAAGVMGGPVAPYTARVQHRYMKRRSYAELISYLTPPIENAGLYKELATLKDLVMSYRQSTSEPERVRLFESIEEIRRETHFQHR